LVVEDEGIIARDIERALKKRSYRVIGVVATGEEALLRVVDQRPDLVLMDIMLKGDIDGIETAQQLRDQFGVPVVYLTAYGDPTTLQRASATSPYGYLLKPFEERELYAAVESALERHQMERDLRWSRQQVAGILAGTFDGIIVSDADGVVSVINAAALELTEWANEDAVGKDWAEVFKITAPLPSDLALLDPKIDPKGETASGASFAVLLSKSGRRIPVEHRSVPMTDAQGHVDGTVLVFRALRLPGDVVDLRLQPEESE